MEKNKKSGKELIEECIKLYGAKSVRDLASMIGLPATSLNNMKENLSAVSRLLLITLIENKKLQKSQEVLDSFVEVLEERMKVKEDKEKNETKA